MALPTQSHPKIADLAAGESPLPLAALALATIGFTLLVATLLDSTSPIISTDPGRTTTYRLPSLIPQRPSMPTSPDALGEVGRGVRAGRNNLARPPVIPPSIPPNSDDRIAASLYGPIVLSHQIPPQECELHVTLTQMTIASRGATTNLCLANPPRTIQNLTLGGMLRQQSPPTPECRDIMKPSHCG